ncbi:MAG: pseudouridine synthase [Desulfobacterales bacterium]
MRLQKYLSGAGFCSRRRGEKYILEGHVRVNDRVITELGTKIDPEEDRIEVDDTPIVMDENPVYIALNKPKGYITTCRRNHPDEKIVMDLIDIAERVYPIGRLDKDSTGLLLLTNDGRLHHGLSHPSFDHEKEYEVHVAEAIPEGALRSMAKGLPMMGTKTRPAGIQRLNPKVFRMVLKEGKNRQIRRMVRKVGSQVADLRRIRIANLKIGSLAEGKWRHLTADEKRPLLKDL